MNLMDDEIVGAVVYQSSNAQLVVVTNEGDMKRLRVSDVEMLGRPVKGSMCCKKRKSNPYEMHSLHLGLLTDQLVLLDEEHTSIMIRDIPLKSKDATFSHVYANKGYMQFFHALQELPVVEYEISNSNQTKEHVENYSLFDETN
jgi:topoisomerase-4 subunit A